MINIKEDRGPLDLTLQIEKLKQKVHDAELETSLVKAIGINSPEMKAANKRIKELEKQIEDLVNPVQKARESGL